MAAPVILDRFGAPMPPTRAARNRALIGGPGSGVPYDAADRMSSEMAGWNPWLGSPDSETTPYRDVSVARIRDIVRNDGWASGIVTRMTDAVVGANFRLAAMPDYRGLQRRFGSKFDAVWAKEFREAAEYGFRAWGDDPARYCDLERKRTFAEIAALAFRHEVIEGESVAALPWRPDRRGYGRARYATVAQLLDPDRLSNPLQVIDTPSMRGGVEIDTDGVPVAYHFRQAHIGDWWQGGKTVTWECLPRETAWGRPVVVHHYKSDRAGDHRPAGGIFMPILARLRMLAQYDRLEVQAAVINAIFGAYIESPYDDEDVKASLDDGGDELSAYQRLRSDFHQDTRLSAGNVRMAKLFPGEKIATIANNRPASAFDMFEGAILRNLSVATGMSYGSVSNDYRGSSYSSERQAMLDAWKTLGRRRVEFGAGFCTPIYSALLEEMIDRGEVPLPSGAPDYAEARMEYTRCKWIGPGRGWIDPVKEVEGAKLKIAAGLSTLQAEAMENGGDDWEEILDQRALETEAAAAKGVVLTLAVTGGGGPGDAEEGSAKPSPAAKKEGAAT